jgi:hypothetical protein
VQFVVSVPDEDISRRVTWPSIAGLSTLRHRARPGHHRRSRQADDQRASIIVDGWKSVFRAMNTPTNRSVRVR